MHPTLCREGHGKTNRAKTHRSIRLTVIHSRTLADAFATTLIFRLVIGNHQPHIYSSRLFDFLKLTDLSNGPPDPKRRSLISNKIRWPWLHPLVPFWVRRCEFNPDICCAHGIWIILDFVSLPGFSARPFLDLPGLHFIEVAISKLEPQLGLGSNQSPGKAPARSRDFQNVTHHHLVRIRCLTNLVILDLMDPSLRQRYLPLQY